MTMSLDRMRVGAYLIYDFQRESRSGGLSGGEKSACVIRHPELCFA